MMDDGEINWCRPCYVLHFIVFFPLDSNLDKFHTFYTQVLVFLQTRDHLGHSTQNRGRWLCTHWSRIAASMKHQINSPMMEDNKIKMERLIEQVAVLTVQVAELQLEIKRRDLSAPNQKPTSCPTSTDKFKAGDRIWILNTIKGPTNWDASKQWVRSAAKVATVTNTVSNRVYFVTDNGVSTWRSEKNIVHIDSV